MNPVRGELTCAVADRLVQVPPQKSGSLITVPPVDSDAVVSMVRALPFRVVEMWTGSTGTARAVVVTGTAVYPIPFQAQMVPETETLGAAAPTPTSAEVVVWRLVIATR